MSNALPLPINPAKIHSCPRSDGGYILIATYDKSTFTEWEVDDVFMGMIERAAGKAPIYHRVCPVCGGGHYFAIGTTPVLDDEPSRVAPAN